MKTNQYADADISAKKAKVCLSYSNLSEAAKRKRSEKLENGMKIVEQNGKSNKEFKSPFKNDELDIKHGLDTEKVKLVDKGDFYTLQAVRDIQPGDILCFEGISKKLIKWIM